MTDKELRKLSRGELVEMLLQQSQEIRLLRKQLQSAEAALEKRIITILESGTMAEAALKLSGVFEAADMACQSYIENIQRMSNEMEEKHEKTQS